MVTAIIKLSASRISSLLCYPLKLEPFLPENVRGAIQTGSFIHLKFGYTNSQQFTRIMEIDNQMVQLTGIPDKIDYENGIVEELKTFHSPQALMRNIKVAKIQIQVYEFITGLNKGKIVMFDIVKGKIVRTIPFDFNQDLFNHIIVKAIELDQLQKEFLKKFNEIQKQSQGLLGGEK